jgi:hypothetical protein
LLIFAQGAILLRTMKMLRPPDLPGVPLPPQITSLLAAPGVPHDAGAQAAGTISWKGT